MDVIFYDGTHAVVFGDRHSWHDWHLIPASKPTVPPPELVENFIDIPGANGQLDLTEILNGFPTYKSREAEFDFILDPAGWSLEEAYTSISNYLHGQRRRVVLADDPDWYYEGRIVVSAAQPGAQYSTIRFRCILDPFKYSVTPIEGLSGLTVDGTRTVTFSIGSSPMRQMPRITSSAAMSAAFSWNGGTAVTVPIAEGTYKYPGIVLGPGTNTLTFTGTGTVSIEARGGSL